MIILADYFKKMQQERSIFSSFTLFVIILIFSPLAFGTVEQWSLTIMEGLTLLALLLFLIREPGKNDVSFYEVPGFIPLLCLWVYLLIQVIPLPSVLVKSVSPETYRLYAETAGIVNPTGWISLSVQKKATLVEFFRFTAYGLFYFLTIQLLTRKERLKRTVTIIVIFSSCVAFLAILQYLLYNRKIFWFRELTMGGTPFGPFVNKNHYAGFMEMVFPVALSIFLALKPKVIYRSLRARAAELFNLRETNNYVLTGFASMLVATSIFLSLSRGGIISLSLSMVVLGLLLSVRKTNRKRGVIITVIFILIFLAVGWFGWEPIFKRFEEIKEPHENIQVVRQAIWKDSIAIIKDFPLTGTGFGNFVTIYPKYRTLPGEAVVDHAHNDYLELLTDGGIVAFLLTAWFVVAVFYKSYKRFLTRQDSYSVFLFIGSFAGMVAILIHSISDFNLHIGSNGLYFFFLAGLMVSAANTRMREQSNPTFLKAMSSPPMRVILMTAMVFFLASLLFNAGLLAGRLSFLSIKDVRLDKQIDHDTLLSVAKTAQRASLFDPFEARYRYAVGNAHSALAQREAAMQSYAEAISLDPLNGGYLQRMGLMYSSMREYERAEKLFRAGIACDATNPARYRTYVLWLLSQGRKEDGIRHIKMSLAVSPDKTVEYITSMVLNGLKDDEMRDALPERVVPHLAFGDYLYNIGKIDAAEEAYRNALHYVNNEKVIRREYFYKVYGYFTRRGLFNEALKVMQQAKTFLPSDAGIWFDSGRTYEELGMKYRAAEEYKKMLILDPKNEEVRKRMNMLTGGQRE